MLFAVWQELREEAGGKRHGQKCPARPIAPRPASAPVCSLLCLAEPSHTQNKTHSERKGIAPGL